MGIKKLFPLVLLALAGAFVLGVLNTWTAPYVAENERLFLIKKFKEVGLPFDNDLLKNKMFFGESYEKLRHIYFYKSYQNNVQTGVFFDASINGYGGLIRILFAIAQNGNLVGIRVLSHQETPGLGDQIETEKSDWILQFSNLDIFSNTWKLRQKGGQFDQITSATITTNALLYSIEGVVNLYLSERSRFE